MLLKQFSEQFRELAGEMPVEWELVEQHMAELCRLMERLEDGKIEAPATVFEQRRNQLIAQLAQAMTTHVNNLFSVLMSQALGDVLRQQNALAVARRRKRVQPVRSAPLVDGRGAPLQA